MGDSMNEQNFRYPNEFPVSVWYEEKGWEETCVQHRFYKESQVGEMLLNMHKLVSATFHSPCDKSIQSLTEQWLKKAEEMCKNNN
jgi:hypothetical protein